MKVATRIKKEIFNRFIANETKLHELTYLFWECTLRCNLQCLHCGSDCSRNSSIEDMPAENFISQARKIAQYGDPGKITVVITGGEPLMRNDIETVGLQLKKLGFRWSIVTNGSLYTEERHTKLLSAGMGAVTLSFDGLKESHNWLRNSPESYSKALNALQLIVSTKRLNSDVVSCVHKKNISELEEIGRFLAGQGVKSWRLFTIAPKGRAKDSQQLALSPDEFTALMEFISKNRQIGDMKVNFSCEGYVGRYENVVRDGYFFCRAGINIGSILVDGSVSACPNIDRGFIQGNIADKSFVEIWKENFAKFRDKSWAKTAQCSICEEFKWCKGNGMHLRDAATGTLMHCHKNNLVEA